MSLANTASPWGLTLTTGAYMGERNIGLHYDTSSSRHRFEFSYGETISSFDNEDSIKQLNLKYTFMPFHIQFHGSKISLFQFGGLVTHWLSDKAYVYTSSPYPEKNYYENNQYHLGFIISHCIAYKKVHLFTDWVMLDRAAIALHNNTDFLTRTDAWGVGFGIRWKI